MLNTQSPSLPVPGDETGALAQDGARPSLGRRVIVDAHRRLGGYQAVPLRGRPSERLMDPSLRESHDGSMPALKSPTFLACSCDDIAAGALDGLDTEHVVLQIAGGGAQRGLDTDLLQAARARGFKLAFDVRLLKEYEASVPLASYVILEMGVLPLDLASMMARAIQKTTQAIPLAVHVRTPVQFKQLAAAGVRLFEGRWYLQPPTVADRSVQLSYASLIKLLNLVAREAEIFEIEALLKHEPTLAYKLLSHLNTAGIGFGHKIESFRHAVMAVGMKPLLRWSALLLAGSAPGSVAPAAGTTAVVRGRLMELLALQEMSPGDADQAFMTGLFSMLDVLMSTPLREALALMPLPDAVREAIVQGSGPFAGLLELAKACESADAGLLEIVSQRYRVPVDRLLAMHVEALGWAEQLGV
ncbi:MAG: HDOD domain-containing protein [Pseudacidovorax sp.]|nr:HDOD domain-containing protein [Pseudacidovorax sp.]